MDSAMNVPRRLPRGERFFFGLCVCLCAPALAQVSPKFETPVNLSNNPTSSQVPDVAASGSNVYVVWNDLSPAGVFRIRFRRSTDEGRTFEDAVTLSNNAAGLSVSGRPRVASAGSDVYVVWEDDTGSTPGSPDIFFRRSLDEGQTWDDQQVTNLSSTPSSFSKHPAIAVAGPEVYVVWEETLHKGGGTAPPVTQVVIRFRRSLDQGKSFDDHIDLSVAPFIDGDSANPAIAATGSAVYVVWNNQPQAPELPQVWFLSSLDEGSATGPLGWNVNTAQNVSGTTGSARNPSVSAAGGAVFISWEDNSKSSSPGQPAIFYNLSADQGTSFFFTPGHNIDNLPPSASLAPRAAASGSVFSFIWQDFSTGNYELSLSLHSLTSGNAPGSLDTVPVRRLTTTTPGYSILPSIAMAGSRIYVVWAQNLTPNNVNAQEVMFMRTAQFAGVSPTNLSLTAINPSVSPSVAVTGSDVYTVWSEVQGAQSDIFFLASFDAGRTFTFRGSPMNLSSNSGMSANPQVAASGEAVYVVWEDDTGTPGVPDIFFRRSLDRGETWEPPIDQPAANLSQFLADPNLTSHVPAIAAAGGELYVAWEDYTKGSQTVESPQIFFRRFVGAAVPGSLYDWDPPLFKEPEQLTCVTRSQCKAFTPSLAAVGSNVYGAWQLDNDGLKSIQFAVSYNQNGPQGFANSVGAGCGKGLLDSPLIAPFPSDPKVAAAGSNAYVAWLKDREVYFEAARLEGNNCVFAGVAQLSFGSRSSHAPVLAAGGGEVYTAWADDGLGVRFLRSIDEGASFFRDPSSVLIRGVDNTPVPWLAADGAEIYLAWQQIPADSTGYDAFLRSSTDQGATFPGPSLPGFSLPGKVTVGPGQSTVFPVSLLAPAGPGGVFVTLTSSDPTKVVLSLANEASTSFLIPAGATTPDRRLPTVYGIGFGSAVITVTAAGFPSSSAMVQVTATLSFSPNSVTLIDSTRQARLTLTLSAPAPAGGLTVTLASDNTLVATVPPIATIPAGAVSVVVPVTGVMPGSAMIHAGAPPNVPDTLASVTVISGLSVTTTSLVNGQVGVPYSQTLAATGATAPYTWILAGGTLPPGLALNPGTGRIAGTPTTPVRNAPLLVQVTDSNFPPQTATAILTLTVTQ